MERFLLFDSGCSMCRELAHAIQRETNGQLKARSLREPEVKALLDRARPGWRWEPTLLEVDGDHAHAFTGFAMRTRLLVGLGPATAWRVARLVRRAGVGLLFQNHGFSTDRRGFLRRCAIFAAGLFALPYLRATKGPNQNTDQPRHLFDGIQIKNSRELKGAEKAAAIQQVLSAQDLKNVLGAARTAVETDKAVAVLHELETGNTLLAIGFPAGEGALVHYRAQQPINGFVTFSGHYIIEDSKIARLVSASVNGRTLVLSKDAKSPAALPECPDCWSSPDFTFTCRLCGWVDVFCAGSCCSFCGFCGGNVTCLIVCLSTWCLGCLNYCCTNWYDSCCACY